MIATLMTKAGYFIIPLLQERYETAVKYILNKLCQAASEKNA
jgi:hypothetical protein